MTIPGQAFTGPATPLQPGDVGIAAARLGVAEPVLRAVMAVESAGKGFDAQHRPIILPEPHVAWRQMRDPQRGDAYRVGLVYPTWGTKPYPPAGDARWRWVEAVAAYDAEAACRACSWGLGQVLGENFALCGYRTAVAMARAMAQSEAEQLDAMVGFIIARHLDDELRRLDWAGFARGYNGPGQVAVYSTRLAAAYAYAVHPNRAAGGSQILSQNAAANEAENQGVSAPTHKSAQNLPTRTVLTEEPQPGADALMARWPQPS